MKITLRIVLFLSILVVSTDTLQAQNDSIQDNSYIFDDGGISESKNLIKVNVLSIINGDLPFYYERILSKSLSIEIGAGILLPYFVPELPQLFSDEPEIENPDLGYSIWVNPKYYYHQKAPEMGYMGIQYRRRNYNVENESIILTDLTVNFGFQLNFGKRLVVDYNIGAGYKFKTLKSINIKNKPSEVSLPIGIKLGFIL